MLLKVLEERNFVPATSSPPFSHHQSCLSSDPLEGHSHKKFFHRGIDLAV